MFCAVDVNILVKNHTDVSTIAYFVKNHTDVSTIAYFVKEVMQMVVQ